MSPSQIRNLPNFHQIPLPTREYGYRTTPLGWEELVQIISVEKNLAKLSRSMEQQRIYMVYRDELLKEYKSVYDHILISKFEFDKQKSEEEDGSLLWTAYPPLSQVKTIQKVLKPNDFPYYTANGIEHWCLWKLCEDVTDEDIEEAKQELRSYSHSSSGNPSKVGEKENNGTTTTTTAATTHVDFLSWRNPPHLKSLPDIDHIHILCRRRNVTSSEDDNDQSSSMLLNSSDIYNAIVERFQKTGKTYAD